MLKERQGLFYDRYWRLGHRYSPVTHEVHLSLLSFLNYIMGEVKKRDSSWDSSNDLGQVLLSWTTFCHHFNRYHRDTVICKRFWTSCMLCLSLYTFDYQNRLLLHSYIRVDNNCVHDVITFTILSPFTLPPSSLTFLYLYDIKGECKDIRILTRLLVIQLI